MHAVKNRAVSILPLVALLLAAALIVGSGRLLDQPKTQVQENSVQTNDRFIDLLSQMSLNLSDEDAVFRYVFQQLPDEVIVYPTENYYYTKFFVQGRVMSGIFSLSAKNRDKGVFGFGYVERHEDPTVSEYAGWGRSVGGGREYTAQDGVFVKKVDDFTYAVTVDDKTVVFHLHDIGMDPPQKAQLTPEEVFVGPVYDESGLQFFLLFNEQVSRLYLVLNEDDVVPENFKELRRNIILGERTQLAFYLDKENHRKILIGAKGENVMQNNWYDGPFDQMPDNYIKLGKIPNYKEYLERHYHHLKGKLDMYGYYLNESGDPDDGTRVAVGPYLVYFSLQDLFHRVASCTSLARDDQSVLYSCLTEQQYQIPDEKLTAFHELSLMRS